jgi:DtxR family transcriptional regulator, Mn-dependent transcriptional regulator
MKRGATVTRAMEDYLKALLELSDRHAEVKARDLASALGVAPASVTGMLSKLAGLGLVHYAKYRGATLTPAGRALALETLRHHRLLETYLAQALGYPWEEVHEEAERLEHVISETFEDRVDALLGNPTHDPHGDPIPQRDGTLPATPGAPMSELAVGARATITRVTEQSSATLAFLAAAHLLPGTRVQLLARRDGGSTLTLQVDVPAAAPITLAAALAAHIRAQPDPEG